MRRLCINRMKYINFVIKSAEHLKNLKKNLGVFRGIYLKNRVKKSAKKCSTVCSKEKTTLKNIPTF
jgi:hypothetical protein